MKNKIKSLAIIIAIVTIIFSSCYEEVIRTDCAEKEDIQLVIKGEYFKFCEPDSIFNASGASFKILQEKDTLFIGNLNPDGTFDTGAIEHSSCGLNNIGHL